MVSRSVPFYDKIQWIQDALAVSLLADGEQRVCDLGSYNGHTIAAIGTHPGNHEQMRFVGIDNSCDMLDKSGEKLLKAAWETGSN